MSDAGRTPRLDGSPPSTDRRALLKKTAVAGAVVWTSPMLVSSRASAQVDGCTPKCEPVLGPASATVTYSGCSGGSDATINVSVTPQAGVSTCPCDDQATFEPSVITLSNISSFGGALPVTRAVTVACGDRSPDDGGCTVPATLSFTVTIINNHPNGHCSQISSVGVAAVQLLPA